MRRTVPVLLAAALLAPTAAQATPPVPKPSRCGWADPSGDARAPERDIVCVDVATSAKDFAIVLRLAGTPGQDQAGHAVGGSWSVSLLIYGVRVLARLERSAVVGTDKWSLTVGGVPRRLVAASVGADRTVRWTTTRGDVLGGRPTVRIVQWGAETALATVTDDTAAGTAKG
jgi:hypothetical protein